MYIQAPILSNSKPIENTGGRSSQLEKFGCCKANAANERGHNMPLNGQFRETFTLQHFLSLFFPLGPAGETVAVMRLLEENASNTDLCKRFLSLGSVILYYVDIPLLYRIFYKQIGDYLNIKLK